LLDYLGQEFRENSYDLKQLIHWIALSEAYSLSSKWSAATIGRPAAGRAAEVQHFYLRQMQAEQLYESLLVATSGPQDARQLRGAGKAKSAVAAQFVIAFGTDEGDESTTFNGTIPQALMMFNGDMIKQGDQHRARAAFLQGRHQQIQAPEERSTTCSWRPLARKPVAELDRSPTSCWRARQGRRDAAAALQDMWWAVLNSNEFIMNH
jgi:hypothetical protein